MKRLEYHILRHLSNAWLLVRIMEITLSLSSVVFFCVLTVCACLVSLSFPFLLSFFRLFYFLPSFLALFVELSSISWSRVMQTLNKLSRCLTCRLISSLSGIVFLISLLRSRWQQTSSLRKSSKRRWDWKCWYGSWGQWFWTRNWYRTARIVLSRGLYLWLVKCLRF